MTISQHDYVVHVEVVVARGGQIVPNETVNAEVASILEGAVLSIGHGTNLVVKSVVATTGDRDGR